MSFGSTGAMMPIAIMSSATVMKMKMHRPAAWRRVRLLHYSWVLAAREALSMRRATARYGAIDAFAIVGRAEIHEKAAEAGDDHRRKRARFVASAQPAEGSRSDSSAASQSLDGAVEETGKARADRCSASA